MTYIVRKNWRKQEAKRQKTEGPERSSGIGGSEAAIVLGISKWGSPASLWAEKAGLIDREPFESAAHSLPYWGVVMEPVLLREFAMDHGREIVGLWYDNRVVRYLPDGGVRTVRNDPFAWALGTIRHPVHTFMTGHIDGLILGSDDSVDDDDPCRILGIVDAKTSNSFMAKDWGEAGSDEVPADYLCQVTHYLTILEGILGFEIRGHVAMLLGGMTWNLYEIGFHRELSALIVEAETEFWDSLESGDVGQMPAIPQDSKGLALLKRLYPVATEPEAAPLDITARLEWVKVGDDLNEARLLEKEAKKRREAIEVQFQDLMGARSEVTVASRGWGCSWKNSNARTPISKAIQKDLLALTSCTEEELDTILTAHTKPSGRRFSFSTGKTGENNEG